MDDQTFLTRLQTEATLQAKLQQQRILPAQLDGVTSFIGRHSWPVLAVLALATSLAIEVMNRL